MAESEIGDKIVTLAPQWSFEGDCLLLEWMQQISNRIEQRVVKTTDELSTLSFNIGLVGTALDNANNSLSMLQYTQFVESRVHDDDESIANNAEVPIVDENANKLQSKSSNDELKQFLKNNMQMLHNCHEKLAIDLDDSDEEEAIANYIYQPKNTYNERSLPHIYGSKQWKEDWYSGICDDYNYYSSAVDKPEEFSESSQSDEEIISSNNINSDAVSQTSSQATIGQEQLATKIGLQNATSLFGSKQIPAINEGTEPLQQNQPLLQTAVAAKPILTNRTTTRDLFANIPATPPSPTYSTASSTSYQPCTMEPDILIKDGSCSSSYDSNVVLSKNAVPSAVNSTLRISTEIISQAKTSKRKPVNLFDDDEFKSLMNATAEKTKRNAEPPVPAARKTLPAENNTFAAAVPETKVGTSKVVNLFDETDRILNVSKNQPTTLLDNSATSSTVTAKLPKQPIKLFDDDDDDFLSVLNKSRTKPTFSGPIKNSLFDSDNDDDSYVAKISKPIQTRKTAAQLLSQNLFADDEFIENDLFEKSENEKSTAITSSTNENIRTTSKQNKIDDISNVEHNEIFAGITRNKSEPHTNKTIRSDTNLFNDSDNTESDLFSKNQPKLIQKKSESVIPINLFNDVADDDDNIFSNRERINPRMVYEENASGESIKRNVIENRQDVSKVENVADKAQVVSNKHNVKSAQERSQNDNVNNLFDDNTEHDDIFDASNDKLKAKVRKANNLFEDDSDDDQLFDVPRPKDKEFVENYDKSIQEVGNANSFKNEITSDVDVRKSDTQLTINKETLKSNVSFGNQNEHNQLLNAPQCKIADNPEIGQRSNLFNEKIDDDLFPISTAKPTVKTAENTSKSNDDEGLFPYSSNGNFAQPSLEIYTDSSRSQQNQHVSDATTNKKLSKLFDDADEENIFGVIRTEGYKTKDQDSINDKMCEEKSDEMFLSQQKLQNVIDVKNVASNFFTLASSVKEDSDDLIFENETKAGKAKSIDRFDKNLEEVQEQEQEKSREIECSHHKELSYVDEMLSRTNLNVDNESEWSTGTITTESASTFSTEPANILPTAIPQTNSSFAGIFLDEPPDDDDFSETWHSSAIQTSNKFSLDIDNDFLEPALPELPNVKTQADDIATVRHNYTDMQLFSDVPPDDIGEDDNRKQLSKESNKIRPIHAIFNDYPPEDIEVFNDVYTFHGPTKEDKITVIKSDTEETVKETVVIEKQANLIETEEMQQKAHPVKINKLKPSNIQINVQALLPGASNRNSSFRHENIIVDEDIEAPKDREHSHTDYLQNTLKFTSPLPSIQNSSTENASKANLLSSVCKNRVRGPAKRKPSTKRGRLESYQRTIDNQLEEHREANTLDKNISISNISNVSTNTDIEDSLFNVLATPSSTNSASILTGKHTNTKPLANDNEKSRTNIIQTIPSQNRANIQTKLFDEDSDSEDDLFKSIKTGKATAREQNTRQPLSKTSNSNKNTKIAVVPEQSTSPLFGSDSDGSDDFLSVNKNKEEKKAQKTNSKVSSSYNHTLFSDEESDNDLFNAKVNKAPTKLSHQTKENTVASSISSTSANKASNNVKSVTTTEDPLSDLLYLK